MKKFKTFVLIASSLLTLSSLQSCSGGDLGNLVQTAQSFQNPKVSIKSFNLDNATLQEIKFKVTLAIENPNSVGIKTSNIEYNLELAKTKIISGNLEKGVELLPKKTVDVEIPITVDSLKLLSAVPSIATNLSDLDYSVYGVVNFDTPVGKVPLNWKKEDKINLISLGSLIFQLLTGFGK